MTIDAEPAMRKHAATQPTGFSMILARDNLYMGRI